MTAMSVTATKMPGMSSPWHPWRALRQRTDVRQLWEHEPGLLGSWCERTREIRLHPDLSQAERRCTLTHELIHAERGDTSCDESVHREAARRLIKIGPLLSAVAFYGEDWPAVAEELWVDEDTLRIRLASAHPSERGALSRCLVLRAESA